jgi:hypothetical protein
MRSEEVQEKEMWGGASERKIGTEPRSTNGGGMCTDGRRGRLHMGGWCGALLKQSLGLVGERSEWVKGIFFKYGDVRSEDINIVFLINFLNSYTVNKNVTVATHGQIYYFL